MKAMILAAGEGTRLRPLTIETPKVLLPLGGTPLIEHTLGWLKSHSIQDVAINLHYLGWKIENWLGDGSRFGIKLHYSREETPLGTAGGVKKIAAFFDDTFIVVYGDMLADFDLSDMIQLHHEKKAMATIALLKVADPRLSGIVTMNEDGRILSFVEKPSGPVENGGFGNGAVYVLENEVLDYIPGGVFSDFARDIFPRLLELDIPVYGYFLKREDYLLDIGTVEKYQKANEDVLEGKVKMRCCGKGHSY